MVTSTQQNTSDEKSEQPIISRINHLVIPPLLLVTLLVLSYGLFQALFDIDLGQDVPKTQRILFLHIPAMWIAISAYGVMTIASLAYLVFGNHFADLLARNTAPIGSAFSLIALVSGSLWGRPEWGVWWIWDARLTALLALLFLYVGYMSVSQVKIISDANRKISAILLLFGALNLPIIKFSVDWWSSNHVEVNVHRLDTVVLDSSYMLPFLCIFLGFLGISIICVLLRVEGGFYQQKWVQMQLQYASY